MSTSSTVVELMLLLDSDGEATSSCLFTLFLSFSPCYSSTPSGASCPVFDCGVRFAQLEVWCGTCYIDWLKGNIIFIIISIII